MSAGGRVEVDGLCGGAEEEEASVITEAAVVISGDGDAIGVEDMEVGIRKGTGVTAKSFEIKAIDLIGFELK